jgi:hypothetical protein
VQQIVQQRPGEQSEGRHLHHPLRPARSGLVLTIETPQPVRLSSGATHVDQEPQTTTAVLECWNSRAGMSECLSQVASSAEIIVFTATSVRLSSTKAPQELESRPVEVRRYAPIRFRYGGTIPSDVGGKTFPPQRSLQWLC